MKRKRELFIKPPDGMCKAEVCAPTRLSFGMALPALTCNRMAIKGGDFCEQHKGRKHPFYIPEK